MSDALLHRPACPHPYGACDCGVVEPKRVGDWMQTFTGKAFYPLDPRPDEIDAEDIAHALSMICRYGGQSRYFYSVAEHSVHVSEWVESVAGPYDALWALLHDAPEAYIGDMVRPIKRLPQMQVYRDADDLLMGVICYKFGLDPTFPEVVHEADGRILLDERAKLFSGKPPKLWYQDTDGTQPLGVQIGCWTPAKARSEFWTRLTRLRQLVPQR